MISSRKRRKILSEVKPVENIGKTSQRFLEVSLMQKEILPSHNCKTFGLKEDNPLQRNYQNQLSHPGLSHIEQECQGSLIHGKIYMQQNMN